ncbi:hypothetical protein KAU19_06355 [Candidatus Parcubacteria bacterium]|nr:hypothetical protein [Candidatus Parcubacteria bacterium]
MNRKQKAESRKQDRRGEVMEMKKKLDDMTWGLIEKIIGIIVDVVFYLAKRYPNSFFKKFIL